MNKLFETIKNRRSIGNLTTPMPSNNELNELFALAMTAPDHKQLNPWRFVVLTGDGLDSFGQALERAGKQNAKIQGEKLSAKDREKLRLMPRRAPMIVAVISDYKPHKKVPEFEQLLALGACVQNFLLGLQSLGYHSVWRTGLLANHAVIQDFFAVQSPNIIAGFLYIGTSDVVMPKRKPINVDDFVQYKTT